jgi:hypothetical protein
VSCHNHDLDLVKRSLETEAEKAMDWFTENSMKANATKFQCILFSNTVVDDFKINIKGVELCSKESVIALGAE